MVNWIKDVDTGELFPIPDNPYFEVPAHLELAEYTPVDYEKTTKMTIDELQNQLLAAQNQIEEMQKTESDTSPTEIIQYQGRLNVDDVFNKGKSRSFNLNFVIYALVIVVLLIFVVFMCTSIIKSDSFDTSSSEITEYQVIEHQYQEQLQEQEQSQKLDIPVIKEYINRLANSSYVFVFKLIPIILTVLGIRFAIHFMISVMRGS